MYVDCRVMHPSGVPGRVDVRPVSITQGATATSCYGLRASLALIRVGDLDDLQRLAEHRGVFVPFLRVQGEDRTDRRIGDGGDVGVTRLQPGLRDDGCQPGGLVGVPEGAIMVFSSLSRPRRATSPSSVRASSDAPLSSVTSQAARRPGCQCARASGPPSPDRHAWPSPASGPRRRGQLSRKEHR